MIIVTIAYKVSVWLITFIIFISNDVVFILSIYIFLRHEILLTNSILRGNIAFTKSFKKCFLCVTCIVISLACSKFHPITIVLSDAKKH